jgi:hypothetical protein
MTENLPKAGDKYRSKHEKDFVVEIIDFHGNALGAHVLYISKEMTAANGKKLGDFLEEFEPILQNALQERGSEKL